MMTSNGPPAPAGRTQLVAGLVGVALASVIVLAASKGDVDRMVRSDGLVYRYVAAHLNQDPDDVIQGVVDRGTSLRYGRIGLPIVLWAASGGRPEAMPYAQPIVVVLAAGFAAAAAVRLLPQAGTLGAVVPFLAPGFSISIVGGYAEVLAIALALWSLVFLREERWSWTLLAMAGALLAKENAAVVLAGAGVWLLLGRRPWRLVLLGVAVLPVAAWYTHVWARYGHVPIFDPYLSTSTDAVGTPFLALWHSLADAPARNALLAGIHLMIAAFAVTQWRRGLIGAIAAASALPILGAGPFAWHFTAEAARVFVMLQLFAILAFMSLLARRMPESGLAAESDAGVPTGRPGLVS